MACIPKYVYCVFCYHVIAAPYVKCGVVSLYTVTLLMIQNNQWTELSLLPHFFFQPDWSDCFHTAYICSLGQNRGRVLLWSCCGLEINLDDLKTSGFLVSTITVHELLWLLSYCIHMFLGQHLRWVWVTLTSNLSQVQWPASMITLNRLFWLILYCIHIFSR